MPDKKRCPSGKVRNPKTGRCINKQALTKQMKKAASERAAAKSKTHVKGPMSVDGLPLSTRKSKPVTPSPGTVDDIPLAERILKAKSRSSPAPAAKKSPIKPRKTSSSPAAKKSPIKPRKTSSSPAAKKSPIKPEKNTLSSPAAKKSRVVKPRPLSKTKSTKEPPPVDDPLRIFYTSLLRQKPDSKLANEWMRKHGLDD